MKTRSFAAIAFLLGIGSLAFVLMLLLGQAPRTAAQGALQVVVGNSIQNDTSPELGAIPLPTLGRKPGDKQAEREIPLLTLDKASGAKADPAGSLYPIVQSQAGAASMPSPLQSFEGVGNVDGVIPPDTNGDVGPNHYVQWINLSFAVFTKTTGALAYGPVPGNVLWTGFGGPCEDTNDGDPIVLYDSLAQRWLMSQFALPNFPSGPFYQCIAVSTSSNPIGAWNRYAFLVSNNKMNDYPHFGVWPDGYYMSVNQFDAGSLSWAGAGVFVFDRAKMLIGSPASFQAFDLESVNDSFGGMLPSDLDGLTPPSPGAPNYFVEVDDAGWIPPDDALRIWRFHVDWVSPVNSTFGLAGQPNATLTVANWAPICPGTRQCVPQPSTTARLDAIGDRIMHRLAYRNFGTHQTLVVNHTVDAGSGRAGIRWYEIRDPGGSASIYQQGTYAPSDAEHRWMGSIAMDHNGNVALGYSVSSNNVYPSIRYTGRLASDPLGALPQGEVTLVAGGGSQTSSSSRWGDYSAMTIDPVDDCTFWYTNEYYPATSNADWHTRIGSFRFPSCSLGPTGQLRGTVTSAATGSPVAGAIVQATASVTRTGTTQTGPDGAYAMVLPVGTYAVTATAYAYQPATVSGVAIVSGTTTTRNIALTPAPLFIVSGTMQDARTGWPLYASINITGYPGNRLWNNPVTGFYSVTLAQGGSYGFSVQAWAAGYTETQRVVGPLASNRTENFALNADLETCRAQGYSRNFVHFSDFELSDGGYIASTAFPTRTTSWAWGEPTSGPGSAFSGANAWATGLTGNYGNNEDGYLTSPNINLSAYSGKSPLLVWRQWLQTERCCDFASLEVSNDGGGTWTRVYGELSGDVDISGWTEHSVLLSPAYTVNNFRVRFRLRTDSSVTKPGWYVDDIGIAAIDTPPVTVAYSQNFETNTGAYITGTLFPTTTTSWARGTPSATPGPGSAHSGVRVWATNLSGDYQNLEDGFTSSPNIDLSAYAGQEATLAWWQWLRTESCCDFASLEVSKDGGASWTRAYGEVSGAVDVAGWTQRSVTLDPSYAVSNFRIRFRLRSDYSITAPGWYIDDVTISMSPPLPPIQCNVRAGGLLVGNVYDANTSLPLAGAHVTNDEGRTTVAKATEDPAVADSFFTLFALAGAHPFTATLEGYGPAVATPTSVQSSTVRQDFNLPAGFLSMQLAGLHVTLTMGTGATAPFTLTNSGRFAASYEFIEVDRGFAPILIGPSLSASGEGAPAFESKNVHYRGSAAAYLSADPTSANEILRVIPPKVPPWTSIADYPVQIMDNTAAELDGKVFSVGGYDGANVVNSVYIYSPDGWLQAADMTHERQKPAAAFVGGLLYVVGGWDSAGVPNPTLEIYDPNTNSWSEGAPVPVAYAASASAVLDGRLYVIGGCRDSCGSVDVYRYNSASNIWDKAANYPVPVSWQACGAIAGRIYCAGGVTSTGNVMGTYMYNPAANTWTSRQTMPSSQWAMGYTVSDGLLYTSGGVVADAISNKGFVYDPDANAWGVLANSNNTVYRGASACGFYKIGGSIGGFSPVRDSELHPGLSNCAQQDVTWLSETPISDTIGPQSNRVAQVGFNAGVVDQPGEYRAQLSVQEDTPYSLAKVPVTMTVAAPPGWGQVHGRVYSLGYCDSAPALLTGARVLLTYGSGLTHTLVQGSGVWSWWAPAGLMSITASASGHVTQTVVTQIPPGQGVNEDVNLRLFHNCGGVTPAVIDVTLAPNGIGLIPISLTNRGTMPWSWSLGENHSWLSITGPLTGVTPPDGALSNTVVVNTIDMISGSSHIGLINVAHDDERQANPLPIMVRLTVSGSGTDLPFEVFLPIVVRK